MPRSLIYIFIIILIEVMGLGIIIPILPFVTLQNGGSAHDLTYIAAAYAGALFISAPIWGYLSDKFGRKPILLISLLGMSIGYIIFSISTSFEMLVISRAISGLFSGTMSTASAYIYDSSTPERREKNMGLIGMAYGIGFIIGPAIGGLLGQVTLWAPTAFMAIVCLGLFLFLIKALPESHKSVDRKNIKQKNIFATFGHLIKVKGVLLMSLFLALFYLGFQGYSVLAGAYFQMKFDLLPWHLGLFMVVSGLGIAISQFTLLQPGIRIFGPKRLIQIAVLVYSTIVMILAFLPSFPLIIFISFINSMFMSLVFAPSNVISFSLVSDEERGSMSGLNSSNMGLMSFIAPLITGWLFDNTVIYSPQIFLLVTFFIAAFVISFLHIGARQAKKL